MPEIIYQPKKRRRGAILKKCGVCKVVARYLPEETWTEHGNTEARCPGCGSVIFLGRLGRPDTY